MTFYKAFFFEKQGKYTKKCAAGENRTLDLTLTKGTLYH
jgi:hypothetical protein